MVNLNDPTFLPRIQIANKQYQPQICNTIMQLTDCCVSHLRIPTNAYTEKTFLLMTQPPSYRKLSFAFLEQDFFLNQIFRDVFVDISTDNLKDRQTPTHILAFFTTSPEVMQDRFINDIKNITQAAMSNYGYVKYIIACSVNQHKIIRLYLYCAHWCKIGWLELQLPQRQPFQFIPECFTDSLQLKDRYWCRIIPDK
jgi:hypothetical protein